MDRNGQKWIENDRNGQKQIRIKQMMDKKDRKWMEINRDWIETK